MVQQARERKTGKGKGDWMSVTGCADDSKAGPADAPSAAGQPAPQAARRPEKLVIFANKYAGALSRLKGETSLEEYAREAGLEAEVVYTNSGIHLRRILREQVIGKLKRVAVAGGDGTIHSAVQVLANSGVEMGILPQGTANNFANALRLPLDLPSAFRVLAEGEARPVSLGEADGEYFTEAAGAGFFAEALALGGAARRAKNPLKMMYAALQLLLTNRAHRLMLDLDGDRLEQEILSVTVANSYCVGLNFPIAPHARLTDDYLDIVIVEPLSRREFIPYYQAMRMQSHTSLPKVRVLRARNIHISARRPVRVHVDDRARRKTPLNIRIVPEGLRVVVDRL